MEQTYPAAVYNRSISKRNFWIDDFGVEGKYLSSNGAVAVALIVYFGVIALLVLCCCLCGCRSIYKKRRRQRRLQPAANSTPPTPSAGSQRHQQSNQSRPRSGRMVACFSRSRNARPANDNETSRSRNGGWWWSRSRNTANNNNDDIEMGRFRRTLSRALSMNKPRNASNIPPAAPDMPSTPTFPVPVEPPPLYQPPTTIPTTAYQPPTPTSQSLQNNQIIAGDAWSLRASTPPPLFEERERDILHEEEVEGVRTQGLQYDRPLPPYSMARINENGVADYGWWDRWLLNAAR